MKIEIEREEDGRWIAEVVELPGVLVYGETEQEARNKVRALARRVIADRIAAGEPVPPVDYARVWRLVTNPCGAPCLSVGKAIAITR